MRTDQENKAPRHQRPWQPALPRHRQQSVDLRLTPQRRHRSLDVTAQLPHQAPASIQAAKHDVPIRAPRHRWQLARRQGWRYSYRLLHGPLQGVGRPCRDLHREIFPQSREPPPQVQPPARSPQRVKPVHYSRADHPPTAKSRVTHPWGHGVQSACLEHRRTQS